MTKSGSARRRRRRRTSRRARAAVEERRAAVERVARPRVAEVDDRERRRAELVAVVRVDVEVGGAAARPRERRGGRRGGRRRRPPAARRAARRSCRHERGRQLANVHVVHAVRRRLASLGSRRAPACGAVRRGTRGLIPGDPGGEERGPGRARASSPRPRWCFEKKLSDSDSVSERSPPALRVGRAAAGPDVSGASLPPSGAAPARRARAAGAAARPHRRPSSRPLSRDGRAAARLGATRADAPFRRRPVGRRAARVRASRRSLAIAARASERHRRRADAVDHATARRRPRVDQRLGATRRQLAPNAAAMPAAACDDTRARRSQDRHPGRHRLRANGRAIPESAAFASSSASSQRSMSPK